MDAGWYRATSTGWPNTGTWEVDTKRFPRGLRAITDHAHAKGMKTIVWFEPERVTAGTWLATNHPEWLLGGKDGGLLEPGQRPGPALADRPRRQTAHRAGHRPLPPGLQHGPARLLAQATMPPDRQGITEIRHVEGYLAYWDELRRRHPDMLIDTCASGGRRNDLETLRRAVPLLRSDYILEPVGHQGHTYGISFWIPFYGTGVNSEDRYVFRSQMAPHLTACYDMRRTDLDYAADPPPLRRAGPRSAATSSATTIRSCPTTCPTTSWMAWQFDEPEPARDGPGVPPQGERLRDRPLSPSRSRSRAEYIVHDLDSDESPQTASGQRTDGARLACDDLDPARRGDRGIFQEEPGQAHAADRAEMKISPIECRSDTEGQAQVINLQRCRGSMGRR